MSTCEAKQIAKKYADTLLKNQIAFNRIYLYGSHAKGTADKNSDIDVAIIVRRIGRGRKYLDKKMRLWELTPEVDARIEPILLEEKEFKRGMTSIMADEVKKHGIRIQ